MPAFAAADQGYPPVIARAVASGKSAAAPHVGGRIDKPCGVQAESDAEEGSPEQHAYGVFPAAPYPAETEEGYAARDQRNPVVFAEPDEETAADEVGDVALKNSGLRMQGVAPKQPSGVGPPTALARTVGVALLIAVLVVDAMSGYPEDGSAFKSERGMTYSSHLGTW